MKKLLTAIFLITFMIILTACEEELVNDPEIVAANDDVLGYLSYISASFFDVKSEIDASGNFGLVQLSVAEPLVKPEKQLELDLEQANLYVDKLKNFIEYGTEEFGSIVEMESDNIEFDFMVQVSVVDETYTLYYSVNPDTRIISGIFVFDGVEYEIEAENSYLREKTYDQMSEEEKRSLVLMLRNGNNSIIIEYEEKSENEELKQTFSIITYVEGSSMDFNIEIKTELDGYILTIVDHGDVYKFKMDTEEDQEFNYKLDYEVNSIKGKVRILEKTNEFGETVYLYRVQERNIKVDIEMLDPDLGNEPVVIENQSAQ